MSESADLDLKEQLARIDQAREEALKFRRDRALAPWLAVVAISGGVGGIIAGVTAVLRLAGKLP